MGSRYRPCLVQLGEAVLHGLVVGLVPPAVAAADAWTAWQGSVQVHKAHHLSTHFRSSGPLPPPLLLTACIWAQGPRPAWAAGARRGGTPTTPGPRGRGAGCLGRRRAAAGRASGSAQLGPASATHLPHLAVPPTTARWLTSTTLGCVLSTNDWPSSPGPGAGAGVSQ